MGAFTCPDAAHEAVASAAQANVAARVLHCRLHAELRGPVRLERLRSCSLTDSSSRSLRSPIWFVRYASASRVTRWRRACSTTGMLLMRAAPAPPPTQTQYDVLGFAVSKAADRNTSYVSGSIRWTGFVVLSGVNFCPWCGITSRPIRLRVQGVTSTERRTPCARSSTIAYPQGPALPSKAMH